MERETQSSDEFLLLGTYSIVDARRLLTAFEAGKVDYRVEFRDGSADINPIAASAGGAFGQAAQATVSIAPGDKEKADRIHTDVFGDCLPNYDATFFKDASNIDGLPPA